MTLLVYLPICDSILSIVIKILLIFVLIKFISLLDFIKKRDNAQREK